MANQIPLSQGKVALVDDADFERINQHKWCALKHRDGQFYAARHVWKGKLRTTLWMHREIMNAPDGIDVDHVRREDTLDNRRSNLRLATPTQNGWNRKKNRGVLFKGVTKDTRHRSTPWQSRITVNGRRISLGCYATAEEAARSYDQAARIHFGDFARTNF